MEFATLVTVLCSVILGTFAANETVGYKPDGKDAPSVNVPAPAGSQKCYDCSYFKRSSKLEGNKHCAWAEDMDLGQIAQETCDGFCVKDWLEQSALTPYLYVSRYCAKECEEGLHSRYGNNMVRTCCKDDLCNSASGLKATLGGLVCALAAVVLRML